MMLQDPASVVKKQKRILAASRLLWGVGLRTRAGEGTCSLSMAATRETAIADDSTQGQRADTYKRHCALLGDDGSMFAALM